MEGRVDTGTHCLRIQRIYGIWPVNVSVNALSYVARNSTEAVYRYSKWKLSDF